jgi:hypothetical protein
MPRDNFCDLFESTDDTHGSNLSNGYCRKITNGGAIPNFSGFFEDDGLHGFVVSVSNVSCSDEDGCPSASVSVCEFRRHRISGSEPATVDCGGVSGRFVQVYLPGDYQRILPQGQPTLHMLLSPFPPPKG